MNNINLIGRLTKHPTIKAMGPTQNHPLCELRVAYNQTGGKTGYINVNVWGKLAEACGNFLAKGDEIGISGRLDHNAWLDKDGKTRTEHKITARSIDFLRKARQSSTTSVLALDSEIASSQALDAARHYGKQIDDADRPAPPIIDRSEGRAQIATSIKDDRNGPAERHR